MKVLYVITKSNFGGAQRYVFELAKAVAEGADSVAVASAPDGMLVDKLRSENIKHFPIKNFQRDINFLKEPLAFLELWSLLRQERPDVIHINSSKAGVLGALAGRLTGVPKIVFTAHGWPFLERRAWWWRNLAWLGSYLTALLSHQVILVSYYDLNHTNMPSVRGKCTVIHTAVPKIDFKDKDIARSDLYSKELINEHKDDIWLITNGELNQNKNQLTALEAIAKYNQNHNKKIFYSLMSDGEQRAEIEAKIKKLKIEDQVHLLGYVDNGRIYLKAFDIFLLPSKKEGLPYAVLEAGAARLPTIASKVGGIPEIIKHNKTGLLISPDRPDTIVESLERMTTDAEFSENSSLELKQNIEDNFSIRNMIERTKSLY